MSKINISPDITGIPHAKDESILESLEASGCVVEYQCREGMCGSCRCLLTSGEVTYTHPPLAALAAGEILPCICKAKTDITLELPLLTVSKKRA